MADRELMQQARDMIARADMRNWSYDHDRVVLETLDERLALPEQNPEQEPISLNNGRLTQYPDGSIGVGTPHPASQSTTQRREWVGLTDEDVLSIVFNFDVSSLSLVAKAIEAKLKEKNNG